MGLFDGLYTSFKSLTQDVFKTSLFGGSQEYDTQALLQQQLQNIKNDKNIDSTTKEVILNFFEIGKTKEDLINQLDDIKDFYFSQLILDRVVEDALSPQVGESLFSIKVKNSLGEKDESATEYLEEFVKNVNLKKILVDIAFDLLLYGEYALRLDVMNYSEGNFHKGIINIHDDVDLKNILPVWNDGGINYFLTIKDKKLQNVQPSQFVYFVLPGNRIKIKIDGEDDKVLHLRMGRSLIYPVFGLLKELRFLEEIIPQQFINNLTKTKLIGVSMPSKTRPTEAIEISKVYQELINSTLTNSNIKDDERKILDELKRKVGEVKVIPNFGDKGQLEEIEFNSENQFEDIFEKIDDIRKNILITIGIPPSIIDEEGSKGDLIKDHIRYTKKLKSLQNSLKEGLKQLFLIHLQNSGFSTFTNDDLEINFLNILNTDDLEKLEFLDLQISMMDNFKSFIEDMADNEKVEVNWQDYIKFMNDSFENITGFNIFTYKEESDEKEDDDDE